MGSPLPGANQASAGLYSVFGRCLASQLPFDELPAADGPAEWKLEVGTAEDAILGDPLGMDDVHDAIKVRSYRIDGGMALAYDDTGTFLVLDGGRRIRWCPPVDATDKVVAAARLDVLGRVLAMGLHEQGILSLHASAVRSHGRVIAFMGPKHHGKSTLAAAMRAIGAEVTSDDTVALISRPDGTVLALPGLPQLRLWSDSLEAASPGELRASPGPKVVLDVRTANHEQQIDPFRAVYVLTPVVAGTEPPVQRERLAGVPATLALLEHSKLGPLFGREHAARAMELCADVAARVPVYQLMVTRDLARVRDVAEQLAAWTAAE